jgi:hypothetical protein
VVSLRTISNIFKYFELSLPYSGIIGKGTHQATPLQEEHPQGDLYAVDVGQALLVQQASRELLHVTRLPVLRVAALTTQPAPDDRTTTGEKNTK